jgi:cytochrome c biogenesis protein CcdA/thiol-disulfide isomerase/thioredoxin
VALLLGVGFLAGLITALSPCVLPVLPILLAGSANGSRWRPYAIVAGIVVSFTAFTLSAAALLDLAGLPDDFLRNAAIVLLFLVAATLVSRRVGHLAERPFLFLTRRRVGSESGGFLLGLSLGLVFVPCAGPVLAAVSVLAANGDVGLQTVLLTCSYALGAAVPKLAIAIGGRELARRLRAPWLRPALGGLVAASAVAIALGADRELATHVPGYTQAVQDRVERSAAAERELARLASGRAPAAEEALADYGRSPELAGIVGWVNTEPLTLAALRGKVVVIDFWTYSCINCLRTLPYLKAWDEAYRADGLVILGVHSPEFAFERVPANVRREVRSLGLRYPVALDNEFETWNAFGNRYWPAKYFLDRRGHVRFAHFGEGEYERSEHVIRQLLGEPAGRPLAVAGAAEPSYGAITPETYLGYLRLDRYAGSPLRPDEEAAYRFKAAAVPPDHLVYAGRWRVERERAVAVANARLRLRFRARDVHLVMTGRGPVDVFVDNRRVRTIRVDGDRLYTLLSGEAEREGLLELRFAPGVAGYAFTFG